MLALVAGLVLAPLSDAQASLGNAPRQEVPVLPANAAPVPSTGDAVDSAAPPVQRRTRLAEATAVDHPPIRLSVLYQGPANEQASKDNCLHKTGSRLRREGSGSSACAGHGQVFVPER